jgi:ABC-type multidrug transport system permease subunit
MISYRRILLALFAGFFAYLLWEALHLETATGQGAIWPLVVAILVVLMLPEKRLQGDAFVRVVEALKGKD